MVPTSFPTCYTYLASSISRATPMCRSQNTVVLIIGTPETPLTLGNPKPKTLNVPTSPYITPFKGTPKAQLYLEALRDVGCHNLRLHEAFRVSGSRLRVRNLALALV